MERIEGYPNYRNFGTLPEFKSDGVGLLGNLDEPAENAVFWYRLRVRGWVIHPQRVKYIEVKFDDSTIEIDKIHTELRPDVATAYPSIPNAENGGFSDLITIGDEEGYHELVVQAKTPDGEIFEIGRRRILNSRSVIAQPPKYYHIGLITQCNLTCRMCPVHAITSKPNSRGARIDSTLLEQALSGLDKYAPYIKRIGLTDFGEPFLYPEIFEVIDQIHRVCPTVAIHLTTNGTLLSEPLIERILSSHLSDIAISLDAGTKSTYERIRIGSNFGKVVDNVQKLVEMRKLKGNKFPRISANFVLLRSNIHDLPEFVRLSKFIGVDHISTVSPMGIFDSDKKEVMYYIPSKYKWLSKIRNAFDGEAESYINILEEAKNLAGYFQIPFSIPNVTPSEPGQDCSEMGSSRPFIVASGDVYPCCILAAKGSEIESNIKPMGNIKFNSLPEIWESERYTRFIEAFCKGKLPDKVCSRCPRYYNM